MIRKYVDGLYPHSHIESINGKLDSSDEATKYNISSTHSSQRDYRLFLLEQLIL